MTDLRNWLATLWPASYKGQPFFIDRADETGGRGLVVHKFPNRDQPYVEDLGEEPRTFSVTAYLHGNAVDALAAAFTDLMASRGAGMLVLPVRGPVLVQAQSVKRADEKDKLGYVAFECQFVREGAPTALVSVASLVNVAYGAIDGLTAITAPAAAGNVALGDVPDHVAAAVYDSFAAGAATFDTVRLSNAVAPVASAQLRDRFAAIVAAAGDRSDVAALAVDLFAAARDLADAMDPAAAARSMLAVVDSFTAPPRQPSYVSRSAEAEAANAAEAMRAVRLAALAGFADAVLRRVYRSRPEGIAARAEVAARFENELIESPGAANAALYVAIAGLRGAVIDFLSRRIADLAPLLTVSANRSLPSLFWAWRLYGDPNRAGELVARNAVRHPSFMPETLSALAR